MTCSKFTAAPPRRATMARMSAPSSDHTSELYPILDAGGREVEMALRGYARRQVDDYVARSETEIAALTGERDSALSRSAVLAAQLANAHAQLENAHRRLAASVAEITPENVHARV